MNPPPAIKSWDDLTPYPKGNNEYVLSLQTTHSLKAIYSTRLVLCYHESLNRWFIKVRMTEKRTGFIGIVEVTPLEWVLLRDKILSVLRTKDTCSEPVISNQGNTIQISLQLSRNDNGVKGLLIVYNSNSIFMEKDSLESFANENLKWLIDMNLRKFNHELVPDCSFRWWFDNGKLVFDKKRVFQTSLEEVNHGFDEVDD